MTVQEESPFNPDELAAILVDGRLLEKGESIILTEHPPAFPRQQHSRRWHYDIDVRGRQKKLCHLIVGMKLGSVNDRAKKMSAACPEITCRPLLFLERNDGMGFLCLEHFAGESLDRLVEQGRCDSVLWLDCVRRVQRVLERTRQTSTEERLVEEVRSLIDETCGYPGVSEFDTEFLRGPAQRAILAGALSNPIHQQWSNGDFAGRNLLRSSTGELRLIDYEYGEFTHFGEEDWLRLIEFSLLPPGLDEDSIPEMKNARQPWREVHLWIHQLTQLKAAQPSHKVTQHVTDAIGRLVGAVARAMPPDSADKAGSLLIRLISDRQLNTESMIENRTAWAKSLEAELRAAQENFGKLSAEHAERSAWARSLEAQLTTTQGNFEKLSREFDERTAWALALEAELKTTRSAYQQQLKTIEELSEERGRLNAELDAIRELEKKLGFALSEIKTEGAGTRDGISSRPQKGMPAVLEQALVTLAEFKRDRAVAKAETSRLAAAELEARLTADAAASEVQRLTAALNDAQIYLEGLLRLSADLRERINSLEASRIAMGREQPEPMRPLGPLPSQ